MLARLTRLAIVSSGFLLTGCATGGLEINGPTDTACKSFRVIRASKADTVDTKRQVVGHNKAFEAICPGEATSEKKIAAR
jgi:starvation-inducible outer membrane lipoprotein